MTIITKREQGTGAFRLFRQYHKVGIAEKHFHSAEALAKGSFLSTGSVKEDAAVMETIRRDILSPAGIAQHYERGATIHYLSVVSKKQIMDAVVDHIEDWFQLLTHEFHLKAPPVKDFIAFDNLAQFCHESAHQFEVEKIRRSGPGMSFGWRADEIQHLKQSKTPSIINHAKVEVAPYYSRLPELLTLIKKRNSKANT